VRIEQADAAAFKEFLAWTYEPPYDFYDGDDVTPANPERFFVARDDAGELVGFYYFEQKEDALEYGLGLRPELTGRGLGLQFFREGLEFARARFGEQRTILNVAAFNERAVKVYERAGFRITGRHVRTFKRWGDVDFIEMEEQR
jgi:ribosomal-protein-alanine N-acetyltransferase